MRQEIVKKENVTKVEEHLETIKSNAKRIIEMVDHFKRCKLKDGTIDVDNLVVVNSELSDGFDLLESNMNEYTEFLLG